MERNDQPSARPRCKLEKPIDVFWTLRVEAFEAEARAAQRRLDRLWRALDRLGSVDASHPNTTETIINYLKRLVSAYKLATNAWKCVAAGGVFNMSETEARKWIDLFDDKAKAERKRAAYYRTGYREALNAPPTAKRAGQKMAEDFKESAETQDEKAAAWEKAQAFLTAYFDLAGLPFRDKMRSIFRRHRVPFHHPATAMARNDQSSENPRSEYEKRRQLFEVYWTLRAEAFEAEARAEQKRLDRLRLVDASRKIKWIIAMLEHLVISYEDAVEAWKAIAAGGVLWMPEAAARKVADQCEGTAELARKRAANMRRMPTMAAGEESVALEKAAEAQDDVAAAWEKVKAFLTSYADVQANDSWDQVD